MATSKEGGNRKHIATITGAQAEAIMNALENEMNLSFLDKSVAGLAVLEVYEDD